SVRRGWCGDVWDQVPVPALAMACFATAQYFGGSGFIAAFAGGLVAGSLGGRHKHELLRAAEGTGNVIALLTWVAFGAVTVGQAAQNFRLDVFCYALLSLTLIRMLPVMIALIGTDLSLKDRLFVGWFGPRGLASIVFLVVTLDAGLAGSETLTLVVTYTVILSILLHGLSANPIAATYERGPKSSVP
ncbi:MAG: cation:proton antiporter, partial [Pseudomonadota bacterium]